MKVSHITIQTKNFEKEVEFYEKYVGLSIKGDLRPKGQEIVFMAENEGETQIEIINNKEAGEIDCQIISIGFHAQDINKVREQLIDDGYKPTPFISPMPGVTFFFVNDPAGARVQFM